ncbi:MAG TPA: TetR family transcriptional regulator [Longimicrobiales bacterium]
MMRDARTPPHDEAGGVRERILDAALAILHDVGIQGLSQVQVARRANVRQSHLTYYFPKRRDLVEAVAVRFIDGIVETVRRSSGGADALEPGAILRRLADAITDPGHMRMFAGIIVEADTDAAYRAIVVREMRRVQAALAEVFGGGDAEERARLILAMLWGLGLYRLLVRGREEREWDLSFLARLAGGTGAPT